MYRSFPAADSRKRGKRRIRCCAEFGLLHLHRVVSAGSANLTIGHSIIICGIDGLPDCIQRYLAVRALRQLADLHGLIFLILCGRCIRFGGPAGHPVAGAGKAVRLERDTAALVGNLRLRAAGRVRCIAVVGDHLFPSCRQHEIRSDRRIRKRPAVLLTHCIPAVQTIAVERDGGLGRKSVVHDSLIRRRGRTSVRVERNSMRYHAIRKRRRHKADQHDQAQGQRQ